MISSSVPRPSNNHPFGIRPATPDDIAKVRDLLVSTWHSTYDSLLDVEQVTDTTDRWHALDVLAEQAASPVRPSLWPVETPR